MTSAGAAGYGDKPWLAQLTETQRAPVTPPETVLHAFRAAVRAASARYRTGPRSATSTAGSATPRPTRSPTPSRRTSPHAAWPRATGSP